MTVGQLQLSPLMDRRARELQAAFPQVVYTSGRRDLDSQAQAMAQNVVEDRYWVARTYLHAAQIQTAIDLAIDAQTVEQLQGVIHEALLRCTAAELSHISDHLHGDAVDLEALEEHGRLTPVGEQVSTWIRQCPDTKTFLMREGGLVRWHWAVRASAEV